MVSRRSSDRKFGEGRMAGDISVSWAGDRLRRANTRDVTLPEVGTHNARFRLENTACPARNCLGSRGQLLVRS
jgi:hypothetical protein